MDELAKEIGPIKKYLDAASVRHRVIVNNLANVNTPDFRRQDINFSDFIQQALQEKDKAKLDLLKPEIVQGEGRVKANGNNVDVDREVGLLNRNALLYRTFVHLLTMKIKLLRTAITGARP